MTTAPVDPVTVQILRNRIACLMEEMAHHFFRSGYSTIVRESRDFSCVIVDCEGRLITSPPMFYHATAYYHLAQSIMAIYGRDALEDGDVFVSNHPYEGFVPHAPDMAIMAPVIVDGVLIGFASAIAHKADVGGTVPGSSYGQATEMYQEGMVLPPIRLVAGGTVNRDLERLIAANSRQPALVLGDMRSQTGAVVIGRGRMKDIARDLGAATLLAALEETIDAAGREMAAALARLSDGEAEAEAFLDNDGDRNEPPVRLHAKVTEKSGHLTFDFTKSDDQRPTPVNLRPPLVEAACFHALIALIDPHLRYSDSARNWVNVVTRPGSVCDATPPAPCSNYMKICQRLIDVVIEALNPFCPERAAAHAGGSGGSIVATWGRDPGAGARHVSHNQHEIFGSAYGGNAQQDGASGTTVHMSNIYVTPIEIVETEFPCRVTKFELIPGSGGDGEHRGGLSFRREYEALQPAVVYYRGDKTKYPPRGVAGGRDGGMSRFLMYPDTAGEKQMPANCRVELKTGERFRIEGAGGGGYGDPARRSPEARKRDEDDGYTV
ncbi:MAG: hydantoinase B/oxoprolinase family protein [Hyphomicrobiales bacterium]|nr:hydantoinase B/oxoprolinase family protein [Hyphomicrobiales bacterium]